MMRQVMDAEKQLAGSPTTQTIARQLAEAEKQLAAFAGSSSVQAIT